MSRDKRLKIIVNIGLPASGKSTWAKNFIEKNEGFVRVSRDDFRLMLKNQDLCEPKIEKLITSLVTNTIAYSLSVKLSVIYDATNLKMKSINEIVKEFDTIADIEYMFFDVPMKTCIERDKLRAKPVGEAVIKRMNTDFINLKDSFHFQPVMKRRLVHLVPDFNSELPDAVIFDLDGTVALMNKRSPYDWNRVDEDSVNKIVAEQIHYHKSLGRTIIIMSGRDGAALDKTIEWLNFYEIPFDKLMLKGVNDSRKDTIVKSEMYESEIKGKFNILCAYDDRIGISKMWFEKGIFCFNVNQNLVIF